MEGNQIGVPLLSLRPRIKRKPLPSPSRGPKRFWNCPKFWIYRKTRHSLELILLAKEAA